MKFCLMLMSLCQISLKESKFKILTYFPFKHRLLTGCKITDEASVLQCIDLLHSKYDIPTVIISSAELPFLDEQGHQMLAAYISYRPDLAASRPSGIFSGDLGQKGMLTIFRLFSIFSIFWPLNCILTSAQRVRALFPKLDATFFGTGDLFSSLTLIYFEKENNEIDMAVSFIIFYFINTFSCLRYFQGLIAMAVPKYMWR